MILLLPSVFPLFSRLWRSSLASLFRKTGNFRHEVTDEELQFFGEPAQTLEELQEMKLTGRHTTFVEAPENSEELVEIKKGKKEVQRVLIDLTEKSGDSRFQFNQKYFNSSARYDEFKGRKKIISTHKYFKESNNDGEHDEMAAGNRPPIQVPLNRLLAPHMHQALIQMLQKMSLQDLLRFMLTNKQLFERLGPLRHLTKPLHLYSIEAGNHSDDEEEEEMGEGTRLEIKIYAKFSQTLLDSEIDGIRSIPVRVILNKVEWSWGSMWEEDMNAIVRLIQSLPIKKIKEFSVEGKVRSWARIPKLLKDYNVEWFTMDELHDLPIPDDYVEEIFAVPTLTFLISSAPVPQRFFVHSNIPHLELHGSTIDKKGLTTIIKRWLKGMSLNIWGFGNAPSKVDLCSIFLETTLLRHDFSGDLPSIRPLAFIKNRERHDGEPITEFWLVRSDDRVVEISLVASSLFICLKTESSHREPPKALHQL